jgi:hypothetical protein
MKSCIISPKEVDANLYQNIETQEFNIFKLAEKIGKENVLPFIGYYIFNSFNFGGVITYNKFEKWCRKISNGYIKTNPYHNNIHAADVAHTCFLYFKLGDIDKIIKLPKQNICALILSCICHDYKHPGVNNNYLKETDDKLSILYNDTSILENMHISCTFQIIMSNPDYNIFEGIDKKLYKEMRKQMINCVLATDMIYHNNNKEYMNNIMNNNNKENIEITNQQNMNLLIHSSDISNPTKLFDIYFEWAKLVVHEFAEQGDKEKKLNLPCSFDREKITIYQSQLGFINYIVIPHFSQFTECFPNLKFYYDNLLKNKDILTSMQEKDKK